MTRQLDDVVRENLQAVLTNRRIRVTQDTIDHIVWRLVPEIRKHMHTMETTVDGGVDTADTAWDVLTKQQVRALWHAAQGCDAEATGERMGLSMHTVKTHRRGLLKRLGAVNMAHAVYIGMRDGFFQAMPNREKADQ